MYSDKLRVYNELTTSQMKHAIMKKQSKVNYTTTGKSHLHFFFVIRYIYTVKNIKTQHTLTSF